ncbi:MAG: PAS domain-containing sensor histidine kinase [Chromatiales bacterium]|nr:PAS domain-containing sensor histidine kinase [Gammaproteobacteria bacterium]MCP5352474.1 PAS domain-containing sensor histidine kinase [Chromatiales bacterium]
MSEITTLSSDAARARHLAHVVEHLPAAVVIVDARGRVSDANLAARELLGDQPPLVGSTWLSVIASSFQPQADDGHEVTTRKGRRVNIATTPLAGEPGQIVLIKDITETRALQSEMARQARLAALGEMVASLAHQIRTPVASALLYASHLGNDELGADDRHRFADKLISRLAHMEHLIQDMLGFAGGEPNGNGELIDADALIDHAIGDMDAHPRRRDIRIAHESNATPLHLHGNRTALLGALHNLLHNAINACDAGGRIAVAARARQGKVELSVRDDGKGMDAATRERVLEPFFTTSAGGTGLGLAVVANVVRNHGGELQIDSRPGIGSEFRIRLPLASTATPNALPASWRRPPNNVNEIRR